MDNLELAISICASILAAVTVFTVFSAIVYFLLARDGSTENGILRSRIRYGYIICFVVITLIVQFGTLFFGDKLDGEGLITLLLIPYYSITALPILIMSVWLFAFNGYPFSQKDKNRLIIIMVIISILNGYISTLYLIEDWWYGRLLLAAEGIVELISIVSVFTEDSFRDNDYIE